MHLLIAPNLSTGDSEVSTVTAHSNTITREKREREHSSSNEAITHMNRDNTEKREQWERGNLSSNIHQFTRSNICNVLYWSNFWSERQDKQMLHMRSELQRKKLCVAKRWHSRTWESKNRMPLNCGERERCTHLEIFYCVHRCYTSIVRVIRWSWERSTWRCILNNSSITIWSCSGLTSIASFIFPHIFKRLPLHTQQCTRLLSDCSKWMNITGGRSEAQTAAWTHRTQADSVLHETQGERVREYIKNTSLVIAERETELRHQLFWSATSLVYGRRQYFLSELVRCNLFKRALNIFTSSTGQHEETEDKDKNWFDLKLNKCTDEENTLLTEYYMPLSLWAVKNICILYKLIVEEREKTREHKQTVRQLNNNWLNWLNWLTTSDEWGLQMKGTGVHTVIHG